MNTTEKPSAGARKLPKHLQDALQCVIDGSGDDIYFVLGHVAKSTARSYMAQLKRRGLAYTYVSNGMTEVWPHNKGREFIKRLNNHPT